MRQKELIPEFVHFMPEKLLPGILYISLEFGSVIHLCACGECGNKTVTPVGYPDSWKITIDEEKGVTLHPSIGNWQFPCRSHYWIKENKIVWA